MKNRELIYILDEHQYLPEVIFIHATPHIACLAQEGAAGAAEPVQAEQRTHSPASRADPAAPGPQYGYPEGTEEPGGCSHG